MLNLSGKITSRSHNPDRSFDYGSIDINLRCAKHDVPILKGKTSDNKNLLFCPFEAGCCSIIIEEEKNG